MMQDEYINERGQRVVNQIAIWFPVPTMTPCHGRSCRLQRRFNPAEQPVFATVGIRGEEDNRYFCRGCFETEFPDYG